MDQEQLNNLINVEIDKIGGDRLLKELVLSASQWFKYYNLSLTKGIKGYTLEDIAYEALEKVITQDWKWNPSKVDFKYFLTNNVVKGLVKNLLNNKETKESDGSDIVELQIISQSPEPSEELDNEIILKYLEEAFQDDELANNILLGKLEGLKRREIIDSFEMTSKEYDNAMKRFITIIEKLKQTQTLKSLRQ